MADTKGMFNEMGGSSPLWNLTSGAFSETFDGTVSLRVSPGINRYSLKVRDTSLK